MDNERDFRKLIDCIVDKFRGGIDTTLLYLHSGRPFTVRDCGAYEYMWKKLLYSDEGCIPQIRNILPLTVIPVAAQHPETGQSAVFGKVDACLCNLLSHSTKAVLRKGVLDVLCPPEDLIDELLFCYLRYVVARRPKIKLPESTVEYFLG